MRQWERHDGAWIRKSGLSSHPSWGSQGLCQLPTFYEPQADCLINGHNRSQGPVVSCKSLSFPADLGGLRDW